MLMLLSFIRKVAMMVVALLLSLFLQKVLLPEVTNRPGARVVVLAVMREDVVPSPLVMMRLEMAVVLATSRLLLLLWVVVTTLMRKCP